MKIRRSFAITVKDIFEIVRVAFDLLVCRGGHRHLQIGRMLDIDLISEPPPRPLPPDVCIQSVGISVARGAGSDSQLARV